MFPIRLLCFATAGLIALGTGHSRAEPPKPAEDPTEKGIMEQKRQHAHKLLDALTAGDQAALKVEAAALVRLAERPIFLTGSKAEGQPRYKTEEYAFWVEAFKRSAADMLKAAEAKNLDGAALAYSDLTRTCVKCHTHFRGIKK
jgi:cytochrome c556